MSSVPPNDTSDLATTAAAAGVGMMALDAGGLVTAVNARALLLLGRPDTDVLGRRAHELLHGDLVSGDRVGDRDSLPDAASQERGHGCALESPARTGRSIEADSDSFRNGSGGLLPVWWMAAPLPDGHGVSLVFRDTTAERESAIIDHAYTARRHADLIGARQSVADLEWLAELTQSMSSSLDETEVMRRLGRMVVGRTADLAIVDLVTTDGSVERVGCFLAPGVNADVDALFARDDAAHLLVPNGDLAATIESGRVVRLGSGQIADPEILDLRSRTALEAVNARSVIIVALLARQHAVGLLVVVRCEPSPDFDDLDGAICVDIGRRAALAVDNARLYRTQTEIALQMQNALLPAPSADLRVRTAVRYLPAHDQFEVGGDWYDVFSCPDDSRTTVLLIGDVAGHDLQAATTMAAIRNLLRGVAVATDRSCADIIGAVDANLDALGIVGTASTVVMTVRPRDENRWTLTWSNAGHVPPLLIEPDGVVGLLDEVHGPILGSKMSHARRQSTRDVPAGSTVVLYTDGLVETRTEAIDVGLVRLRQAAIAASGLAADPGALVEELLRRNHASAEDDTAILVCHLPITPTS